MATQEALTDGKAPAGLVGSPPQEDALQANSISLAGVLFVAVATMAPGAGAVFAIGTGAPFAGGALPLAVLLALIGSLFVATAIGQLAKHMSSAGGLASYAGASIHSGVGFVVAWAYPYVYLFALPYLALVFGDLLATAIEPSGSGLAFHVLWVAGALACLGAAFAMNYFGAELGAKLGLILGVFEVVVLVVLSICMIVSAGGRNTASVFTTHHATVPGFTGSTGVIAASVFGFLAFIGFETAAPLAEETKDPRRNVPRAVLGSALLVGLFFLLTTYASDVFFGPGKFGGFLDYNEGNPWIGMTKQLWGAGWIVLLITLLNSSLACSNGAAMAATRSMWAMGRSGTVPRWFGHTHPRWKSPVNACYALFGVATVLTLAAGEIWDPVTAYALFGTVLTLAVLPIYFVVSLACPIYYFRYRRDELNVLVHVVVPVLGAAFLVPAFCAGAGIKAFSFVASLTYPINLAGPIVGAWYLLGIGVMVWLLRNRREALTDLALSGHDDAVPGAVVHVTVPAPRTVVLPDAVEAPVLR